MMNSDQGPRRLDTCKLDELAQGDADFRTEMLKLFMEQSVGTLRELEEAFTAGDEQRIRFLGHRMKYQLDMMGSDESRELVRKLENLPPGGIVDGRRTFDALSAIVRGMLDEARQALAA